MKKLAALGIIAVSFLLSVPLAYADVNLDKAVTVAKQAREKAKVNTCKNNLRLIDAVKEQWALENKKQNGAEPTWDDLLPFYRSHTKNICPAGGTYAIGKIGGRPTCSIKEHNL